MYQTNNTFVLVVLFYFPFSSIFFVNTVFATTIEIDKAVQILKIKEKTIRSISWECQTNRYQSDNKGNLTLINEPPLPCFASVYVDSKGRYLVKTKIKVQNTKEVTDIEYITFSTFDGSVKRSEITKVSPDTNRIDGYIYPVDRSDLDLVNWNLYPEGIGYVFPYFSWTVGALDGKTKKLSEYLEYMLLLNRKITIVEDQSGIWTITVPDFVDQQDDITILIQIKFDPTKGKSGAIISVRKCDSEVIDMLDKGAITSYELQEIVGFFVPKIIKQEELMGINKPSQYTVIEYKNVKINESVPETAFNITWQTGTAMIDYVAGKSYLVSDSPIDESQSVRDFMSLEGISKPPVIQNRATFYYRIVLVILALSLITYGLYCRFKKKNES
jgi:hypothetical protein